MYIYGNKSPGAEVWQKTIQQSLARSSCFFICPTKTMYLTWLSLQTIALTVLLGQRIFLQK